MRNELELELYCLPDSFVVNTVARADEKLSVIIENGHARPPNPYELLRLSTAGNNTVG